MEQEPILHVWINHDTDLVDLTLTTTMAAQHGKAATKMSETIHTNKKHPFLTKEKGFLTVGQITLGMHVLRADGMYGVVTGWQVVPGAEMMYDLEVAQDHTFTVGIQQWVVHNCGNSDAVDAARRSFVKQNLFNLIGDSGEGLQEEVKMSVKGASATADFVTNKSIIEVGGLGKNLTRLGKQFSVFSKTARDTGQGVYFIAEGTGIPESLANLANSWGVNIVPFEIPPDFSP
jgi:hypothetical protein